MVADYMDKWEVRYSPCVGDLTVFDGKIYNSGSDSFSTKKIRNNIYVSFDKEDNHPVMIEIPNADKKIPKIDDMDKKAIIKKIREYINER